MENLNFSYNWNNKLDCKKAFSTIRLRNDNKYAIGTKLNCWLTDKEPNRKIGICTVTAISHFKLEKLSESIARIDTGYSLSECEQIIKRMYKNSVKDWTKQELSFIIFVKE